MLMVIPLTSECRVIYNMENMIGRGHYGTVYKGHLEFNDKDQPREQVAIKMLNTMQVSTDFHREIGIMRTLSHPNIVKFKYWAEKSHCIIMEYLQSGSFDIYLRFTAPNLNNPRLVSFALDIANVSGSNMALERNKFSGKKRENSKENLQIFEGFLHHNLAKSGQISKGMTVFKSL